MKLINGESRFVRIFWILALVAFSLKSAFADPAAAAPPKARPGFRVEWVSVEDFISHYQTAGGTAVVVPELVLKGAIRLDSPHWFLEMRHFRGTSQTTPDGFQASVGDFEGRMEYRLDDPTGHSDPRWKDSVSRNVLGWVSWKIWTSTNFVNSAIFKERDEGLGFGITRFPDNEGTSYWYEASIYPSVRTNLADQKNAYTFSTGGVYSLSDSFSITMGYRIQTLRTGTRKTDRAQEQGVLFGIRGNF